VSGTPTWFGPADRPLFGWLHVPDDGTARAGVVLCPPSGYEAVCSHRTLRVVAERLADLGIVALRFDYDGTGDSAGHHDDPDRVRSWVASIEAARDLLRAAGVTTVAAVGMRLGATLAAATPDLDGLVLWDPVWSGRTFVRQLRALQLLGIDGLTGTPPADDGSLAVAGAVYPGPTVEELRSLTLPDLATTDLPVLLLHRPDQAAPTDELARLPTGVDVGEATGQDLLLDGPSIGARVPREAVARVVTWLHAHLPAERRPCTPTTRTDAELGGVVEQLVALGPAGLFGITSEPVDGADPGRPVLLLLNNSVDHHVGPNRMWVDWGRRMVALGFAVARVDLSGIGDSPTRPGEPDDRPYGRWSVPDVADAVRAVDRGAGVVPVGLCSGARNALDAGASVSLRGVCAVNPPLHLDRRVIATLSPDDPRPAAIERINTHRRWRHHVLLRVPAPVWRTLDRFGLRSSRARAIQRVVSSGADTLVVYGADDFYLSRVRRESAWHLARLERASNHRLVTVDGLDHGLMSPSGRDEVMRHLTDHLVATYAAAGVRART
jgi:alpha-beta hydrolase superfamily lysophospholipase